MASRVAAPRVGINGFGRIGRQLLRLGSTRKNIEFVAINDLTDVEVLAHLFKYDSIHGTYNGHIQVSGKDLIIDKKKILVTAFAAPQQLPWKDLNVDIVLECSGYFTSREKASGHLNAGAKKVLVSAPCKNADLTVVMGVNEDQYNPRLHNVISNSSCTTNCLGIVTKVLRDHFGVAKAAITTIHSYTNDQRVLDLPHKDLRRARAAALSMIPTSSGATEALVKIFPELKGMFQGLSVRVPTPNVSLLDLVAELKKSVTLEELNSTFQKEAEGKLKKYLGYCDQPLVSIDFKGDQRSAILDSLSTQVIDKKMVKVIAWYDNEVGFSARMLDFVEYMYEGH